MAAVFISIAGTQIMGTLQPWLAFVKREGPGDACILYTPRTESVASSLADYARTHALGNVSTVPIPYDSSGEGSPAAPATRMAMEAAGRGDRIYFNVDGGMNYLICRCVMEMEQFRPLLIQSSKWRTVLYSVENNEFSKCRMADPLPVEDILRLQNVDYCIDDSCQDVFQPFPLLKYCEKNKIALPPNHLKNVRIGGITFDLVWNPGNNRLSFLKDWRFYMENAEAYKNRCRDFAYWCIERNSTSQLYDKQVFALVADEKTEERLREDSGHQIIVRRLSKHSRDRERARQKQHWEDELKAVFKEWFRQKAGEGKDEPLAPPAEANPVELADNTLVVCIGTNIMPTLLAIASHRPENLVLCHTEREPTVRGLAERLRKLAPELGVRSTILVPFDIEGTFPDLRLPRTENADPRTVDINITPGSKGQGAMLSLWAKKHGFTVWSIYNRDGVCSPLHNPYAKEPIPQRSFDPAIAFRVRGMELLEETSSELDLKQDLPRLNALLEFMRAHAQNGGKLDFTGGNMSAGGWKMEKAGYRKWKLGNGRENYIIDQGGKDVATHGKWFEELTAAALLNAGVERIRLNMAVRWSEEMEKEIVQKYNAKERPHRIELDVVGSRKGDLILISCKSNPAVPAEEVEKAKNDARNSAISLGRFGLPMLAHMACDKADLFDREVMVFGWRELCDKDSLNNLILKLAKKKRSTEDG